jgi:hypothetical protein
VFNFVPQTDEAPKIVGGVMIDGRVFFVEATLKLPVPVCTVLRSIKHTPAGTQAKVPVFNSLTSIVRVK